MLAIGIGVGLLGYGLIYWGVQMFEQRTCNSFLDLIWPGGGHVKPCAPMPSSSSGGGSSTGASLGGAMLA
jgi:hypothetical protein